MVHAGNLGTDLGEVGYGGREMSPMCEGWGIPCIVEMPKNGNEARGTPEQRMAKHERCNSKQGATHWLKVRNWDI